MAVRFHKALPFAKPIFPHAAPPGPVTAPGKDGHDALAALERLLRHKVISEEHAVGAARLITGDPNLVFPPPRPPPAPAAPPAEPAPAAAPEPEPAAAPEPEPSPAPEDNASAPGSEAP